MPQHIQNIKKIMPESVSLCMIVRNEEAVLAECLESARDYVDQIVIVDTGSDDDTRLIAEQYTDEIYHYPWTNDFAAARNESIKYATSKWILVLDADHKLIVDDHARVPEASQKLGFMISEISGLANGSSQHLDRLLLFKNIPGLCYAGKIHEHPLRSIKSYAKKMKISDPIDTLLGVSVNHRGFDDPLIKLNRNLEILDTVIQHEASNSHYVYKYLLTLRGLGRQPEFLNNIEKLVLDQSWDSHPPSLSIVGILGLMGEAGLSGKVSDKVLNYFQGRAPDIGEKIRWADARISVPYAMLMERNSQPLKAINILESCIRHGVAPGEVGASRKELMAPFQLLFSLYNRLGKNSDTINIMSQMPYLLDSTHINTSEVFESISKNDPALFEYIYTQMESKIQI